MTASQASASTPAPSEAWIAGWTAVVPVKAWTKAKTRLEATAETRAEFARSIALDTLDTVAASSMIGRIVVVSAEPELVLLTADIRSTVLVQDPEGGCEDGLNDAIRCARDWAKTHAPTCPVVVIPADLPALTTGGLEDALQQLAWFDRTHVPDHLGAGTTLSAAARPELLDPYYGHASERAHAATGSVPILDVDPRVRLDVDNLQDLTGATSLGLGPRTRKLRRGIDAGARRPLEHPNVR